MQNNIDKETPAEKAKRIGVRLIPAIEPWDEKKANDNPVVAVCGECGRECRLVDMYSCQKKNCPTQPKTTL